MISIFFFIFRRILISIEHVYLYSIRYSYEGIFPTKGAIKSQISDMDDNTKSPFYLPMMKHDNVKTSDSSEGYDCQKEDCWLQFQIKYKVCNS